MCFDEDTKVCSGVDRVPAWLEVVGRGACVCSLLWPLCALCAITIVLIACYTDCDFIPIVLFACHTENMLKINITPGATIPARWQVGVHCPVWSLLWPLCCIVHYTYFASCVLYLWSLSYTYCATLNYCDLCATIPADREVSPGRRQIWNPADDNHHSEEIFLDHLLLTACRWSLSVPLSGCYKNTNILVSWYWN